MKLIRKLTSKQQKTVKRIDQYQEAISFAQAGARSEALEALQDKEATSGKKTGKLLVLAQGDHFPPAMRSYALDMAQRLGYEILALNTAPMRQETWRFFKLEAKNLRQEFKAVSQENFAIFQTEAEERSIPIQHFVKFIDKDEALQELRQEVQDLDFIISDAEALQSRLQDGGEQKRPQQELCVYTLA